DHEESMGVEDSWGPRPRARSAPGSHRGCGHHRRSSATHVLEFACGGEAAMPSSASLTGSDIPTVAPPRRKVDESPVRSQATKQGPRDPLTAHWGASDV